MSLLVTDKSKCSKDQICAEVCPQHIIEFDSDGFPFIKEEDVSKCMFCGHCVAVCPKAALELENLPLNKFSDVEKKWKIPFEQLRPFLQSRRSIRAYREKEVEREKIEMLIDTARYAPTGLNLQSVKWKVVNGKDKVRAAVKHSMDFVNDLVEAEHPMAKVLNFDRFVKLYNSGSDPILLNAPAVILAYGKKDTPPLDKDCVIALTYLELSTYSMYLGACWGGYFEAAVNMWQPLKQFLDIPDEDMCYGALMIGYPKFKYKMIPSRNIPEVSWI